MSSPVSLSQSENKNIENDTQRLRETGAGYVTRSSDSQRTSSSKLHYGMKNYAYFPCFRAAKQWWEDALEATYWRSDIRLDERRSGFLLKSCSFCAI
jgi:hypothetical protein